MPTAGHTIQLARQRYTLRSALGGSSYGVVWRATGQADGGDVALKFINRERMEQAAPELQSRWLESAEREADFLRALAPWDGRHIVRLLDTGPHEGLPVLALELMAGDLGWHVAELRKAGQALPFTQALDWLAAVNQALAKVHQYGWRYLDLKPANLLLTADRRSLKLADFGANRNGRGLEQHSYAGTAQWQAPEQFFPCVQGEDGLRYGTDARADYFALGALFYWLVTSGTPLRWCSLCGQAFAQRQMWGAQALTDRFGAQLPTTLCGDEEDLFVRLVDGQAQGTQSSGGVAGRTAIHVGHLPSATPDGTWLPQFDQRATAPSPAALAALALLRSLLAHDPARRPQGAVEISLAIEAVRQGLGRGGLPLGQAQPPRTAALGKSH